jgi:hypothetical protein
MYLFAEGDAKTCGRGIREGDMNETANILNLINFDVDYYGILGLMKTDVPSGTDRNSRKQARTLLHNAYRKRLFELHPDRNGGDEGPFRELVRAHTILSDPYARKYYDTRGAGGGTATSAGIKVNWDRIGHYRKGSLADETGTTLFLEILRESKVPGIKPVFAPIDENFHNYHWTFTVPKISKEIVLSIVEDEGEVLRLTGGDIDVEDALPFKIYICIPSVQLIFTRSADRELPTPMGIYVARGPVQSVSYLDADMLSTTQYGTAMDYIREGGFAEDAKYLAETGDVTKFVKLPHDVAKINAQNWRNTETGTLTDKQRMAAEEQRTLEDLLLSNDKKIFGDNKRLKPLMDEDDDYET